MKTRVQILLALLIIVKIVLGSIFMYRSGVFPLFGGSDAFAAEQKKDNENTELKNEPEQFEPKKDQTQIKSVIEEVKSWFQLLSYLQNQV